MPAPMFALDPETKRRQETFVIWSEFAARVRSAVADFNFAAGEKRFSVECPGHSDEALRVLSVDGDSVEITFGPESGGIRCRYASRGKRKELEFRIGNDTQSLLRGDAPVSMPAALDLMLLPLVPTDSGR